MSRFPIEVRYLMGACGEWRLYSRHQSAKAANRAYIEAINAMPNRIQMRNIDGDGSGVMRDSCWPFDRTAIERSRDAEDERADRAIDEQRDEGRSGP